MRLRWLAAAFAVASAASPAAAQRPEIAGADTGSAARVAREVLARESFVWIDRDTVLGPDFRATDLVVHDAEVRLEGVVEGTVVILGGDLWIRPGGRVGGRIAVLSGGVYPSAHAAVERDSILFPDPRTAVVVETVDDAAGAGHRVSVRLAPPPRPPLVSPVLTALPTYDRVNGVTVRLEALVRPGRRDEGPVLHAWLAYRALQEHPVGGGVRWAIPVGTQGVHLTGEASRATRTNDGWIFGPVANSVRALAVGSDYRDYWDADVLHVGVERRQERPLIAGESWLGPALGVRLSRDRSLPERSPWALSGRGRLARENPAVHDGTVVSLLAGARHARRAATSEFSGSVAVEHAPRAPAGSAFTQALVEGTYGARALRTHQLRVELRGMAPLGGTEPPPQRRGILGGSGTLPTEPIARFRGDHLFFVASTYAVPVPALALPVVGSPALEALHRVGAAWVGRDEPDWVQNAGLGLSFAFLAVRVWVSPAARPPRPHLDLALSIPQR
jgi:hypothetical protein